MSSIHLLCGLLFRLFDALGYHHDVFLAHLSICILVKCSAHLPCMVFGFPSITITPVVFTSSVRILYFVSIIKISKCEYQCFIFILMYYYDECRRHQNRRYWIHIIKLWLKYQCGIFIYEPSSSQPNPGEPLTFKQTFKFTPSETNNKHVWHLHGN